MASETPSSELVHVLFHRFSLSEPLNRRVAEFIDLPPGSSAPRFFLRSSRTVAVPSGLYREGYLTDQLQEIQANLNREVARRRGLGVAALDGRYLSPHLANPASTRAGTSHELIHLTFEPTQKLLFKRLTNPLVDLGESVAPRDWQEWHYTPYVPQPPSPAPAETDRQSSPEPPKPPECYPLTLILGREQRLVGQRAVAATWQQLCSDMEADALSGQPPLYTISPHDIVGQLVRRRLPPVVTAEPDAPEKAS